MRADSRAAWAALVDEYQAAAFAHSPTQATAAGIHEYDDRLDDRSRAHLEARVAELGRFLERLVRLERTTLPPDDAVDAEALELEVRAALFESTVVRGWEKNPMGYASLPGRAIDGLIKRDFAPRQVRLRSVIARLDGIESVFAAGRANLLRPPREFTDLAINLARGSVGFFAGAVALWAKEAAGGDARLLAGFQAANGRAIESVKEFARWLQEEQLPRSDGAYAIGEEAFLEKLRLEEMIDLPLPELLARGEAQLAEDRAAFLTLGDKLAPGKTPAEVAKLLSDDHPTAEGLLAAVSSSVEEARRFAVAQGLITFPSEERVRVAETPPYARNGGLASMEPPGPFETRAREAYYYVTPVEDDWDAARKEAHLRHFNLPAMACINMHEAYPGHYAQFLYRPLLPTKARKLLGCTSNDEGWAHYCEQMMVDQGFGGDDPRVRLGQLGLALVRDCRHVAGIKLHTQGMTVAQATQLFEQQAFLPPSVAFEEARRGTYDPTYLYYTLGKLMIQDLARDYRQAKGATLKQFHDAFLAQGGLQIPLIRRLLDCSGPVLQRKKPGQ